MKTFSEQGGWLRVPQVIALALLLAVAGCSDDDDTPAAQEPAGPDQTIADGVYTGNIGDVDVVAIVTSGALHALSAHDGTDSRRYRIMFEASEEEVLSAGADDIEAYDYTTNMAVDDLDVFSVMRTSMEMGSGDMAVTVYKLEGKIGTQAFLDDDTMNDNVELTLVDGTDAAPAGLEKIVDDSWSDSSSWTSNADGATTLTFDEDGKLTPGNVAGADCMVEETQFEAADGVDALVAAGMSIVSCTEEDRNGDYQVTAFLNTGSRGMEDASDRMYLVAVKPGDADAMPATEPVYWVFIGRRL